MSCLLELLSRILLRNVITIRKKINKNIEMKINKEGIRFAKQVDILDEIERNDTCNSFVTSKVHKEIF